MSKEAILEKLREADLYVYTVGYMLNCKNCKSFETA